MATGTPPPCCFSAPPHDAQNVLTKGVRDELKARLAAESAAAREEQGLEPEPEREAAKVEAKEGNEDSGTGSNGEGAAKKKRTNRGGRRQKGPKVSPGVGRTRPLSYLGRAPPRARKQTEHRAPLAIA